MKGESTVPVLYPMGVYTFAFACVHCANRHSDKCHLCKCEKKSGFEPKKEENTMKIEFTVPGIPMGKGRPRFTKDGHAHTPQKTRDYENKVVQCWKCQSGKGFAAGVPLRATVTAFFTVPRSTSKKKAAAMDGTPHIKRPDVDNVAKAILDALNGHAYNDDSAIALLTVRKYQTTGASRVEVTIEEAE